MIEPPGECVMRLIIEASEDSLIQAVNVAKAAVKRGRGFGRDHVVWCAEGQPTFASRFNAKSLKVWELAE